MKKLSILRHGKSSWEDPDLDDKERPLLPKGEKRTKRVSKYLKINKITPDYIITSPAIRAMQTTDILIKELKLSLYPQVSKRLYLGGVRQILDKLVETEDDVNHILIVGHNPALTELINEISNLSVEWLPTSACVTIEFDFNSWDYIIGEKGRCIDYITPSELKKKDSVL